MTRLERSVERARKYVRDVGRSAWIPRMVADLLEVIDSQPPRAKRGKKETT